MTATLIDIIEEINDTSFVKFIQHAYGGYEISIEEISQQLFKFIEP